MSKPLEVYIVRRRSRPDQDVGPDPPLIKPREYPSPANFPKPPLEEVSRDNLVTVFGNDKSEAGTGSERRRKKDIHVRRPLTLPPLQQLADFRTVSNACTPREPLDPDGSVDGYLPPICTTICALPRLRRRLSVFRPPTLFMRARNPCLFTRLRLRGLYVGFITSSPIHVCATIEDELEKIATCLQNGQRDTLVGQSYRRRTPSARASLTFNNPLGRFDAPTEFQRGSPTLNNAESPP